MTDCAGVSDASTSAPTARSLTLPTKSLATARLTSASSSATRTSRATSLTSASVSRPRLDSRAKIAPRRSASASSIAPPRYSRSAESALWGSLVDLGHRVADRLDFFRFFIGNVDVEFGLERHDQLDQVERIGTQIVGDRRLRRHFRLVDAELLDDDLLDFVEGCL